MDIKMNNIFLCLLLIPVFCLADAGEGKKNNEYTGLTQNSNYSPVDLHAVLVPKPLGFGASERLWNMPRIPVCWERFADSEPTHRQWVRDAVARTWGANSGVTFTDWHECDASTSSGIRIEVVDDAKSGAHVKGLGNQINNIVGGMRLNHTFNNWNTACPTIHGQRHCIEVIAVHEFGHALAFAHEHLRADTPDTCNEEKWDLYGDITVGAWDLDSVMNYCNPEYKGAGILSATDVQMVQEFYPVNWPEREVTIARYYLNLLKRIPDATGRQFYLDQLAYYGCDANSLGSVVEDFTQSAEFETSVAAEAASKVMLNRAAVILKRVFHAALRRAPESAAYIFYTNAMEIGGLSEVDFVRQVVGSQEFASKAPAQCVL